MCVAPWKQSSRRNKGARADGVRFSREGTVLKHLRRMKALEVVTSTLIPRSRRSCGGRSFSASRSYRMP